MPHFSTTLELMLHSPPRLHKNIKAHFKDFAELRETIRSGKMYTFPTLFDLFCSDVEAGNFRNAVPRKPASIDRYMTIAHEANFRLELWFALGKKSFRHQTYPSFLIIFRHTAAPGLFNARDKLCSLNYACGSVHVRYRW